MMNAEAAKRMEEMAEMILMFPVDRREEAFELLAKEGGLPAEAVQHFREYVFFYHMFTNPRFYKAIEQTVGAMVYETMKQN